MKQLSLYIVFFVILLISIQLQSRKVSKKGKAKNKVKTANDIKLKAETFALQAYTINFEIDGKKCGTGTFTTDSLTKPNGDEKLGWTMKFDITPSQEIQHLFVQSGEGYKWYLPYRSISHDILYVNPFGSPKRFEITVTDDKGKIYHIKANLPYADMKTYINDPESNVLRGLINKLRIENQADLVNYKKTASAQACNYLDIKPLLNAANRSEEDFKAAVKTAANESEALGIIIKADSENYEEIKHKYDKVEKQYIQLRNKLSDLNERISESKNLRIFKDSSANKLKDKKAEEVKPKLAKDLKEIEGKFEVSIAKLSAQVPNESTILQDARKEILEKLDLGKYTKIVGGVYSGN